MSKHDLERKRQNAKRRVDELELLCKVDPMKRKPDLHDELAKLKKMLAET